MKIMYTQNFYTRVNWDINKNFTLSVVFSNNVKPFIPKFYLNISRFCFYVWYLLSLFLFYRLYFSLLNWSKTFSKNSGGLQKLKNMNNFWTVKGIKFEKKIMFFKGLSREKNLWIVLNAYKIFTVKMVWGFLIAWKLTKFIIFWGFSSSSSYLLNAWSSDFYRIKYCSCE